MSVTLKTIYNACNPGVPAPPEYYVDCDAVRGEGGMISTFRAHLRRSDSHLCFLFSGHVGSGKSSELIRLAHELETKYPSLGLPYMAIRIDASPYLDVEDVGLEDIFLMIITEVQATFMERLQLDLRGTAFARAIEELSNLIKELKIDPEVSIGGQMGPIEAKLRMQRLRLDPTGRKKVRAALSPRMPTLIEEINKLLVAARELLLKRDLWPGEPPWADFVLIIDNLEKIQKFEGMTTSLASYQALFVDRATQLTGLKAHVIYTTPLELVRSLSAPQLRNRYSGLYVLPMVKIQKRDRTPYSAGVVCLQTLLARRLEIEVGALAQIFAPGALDLLITHSGGHVRQLMSFVQESCTYTTDLPISLAAARRAIRQMVAIYSTSIPEAFWSKLAELDLDPQQQIRNGDADYLSMLHNLMLLEYVNGGDDETDLAAESGPWYAVHPIVRLLPKFLSALERVKQEQVDRG